MGGMKMEALTIDEARELVSNVSIWPRMRDFLWDFAPQVHPSWLEDMEGLRSSVASSLASSAHVRRYVIDSLGVEPCFHSFPKDDASRLLLLDCETLEAIARWLGAIACVGALRGVTSGAEVRALKAALPGVYPEVFGYMAYFSGMNLAVKDAKDPEEVVAAGFATLYSAFAALPLSLVSRLRFKFPKALCGLCVPCGEGGNVPATLKAVNKLLRLKFPEAYVICCS